ncbi:MAG: site-2 protease family protein [Clostridia bacterium]|nr:site-2 protease family protein [Clostridia bacterium]
MFNFSFDKRIIYIIIGIMVLSTVVNYANNPGALFSLLLSIPGVLIAITFHEFAHGYAAYKLGDNTAKNEGRLSLNPLDHLDPIGSLMLLFAGFGWGKPVHVNPRNYTRKISMEQGEAIVSIAGPLMNILLAVVFTLIYCAIYKFAGISFITSTTGGIIILLISSTISINIGLGVFNLIPLPPLDGSKVIMPFLPYNAKQWFVNNEQIFYIIFVVIWITGIAGLIISPAINTVSAGILNLGRIIFGI